MTKPADLSAIEAEHGFTFGNPDGDTGAAAAPVAALVCTAPTCARRGQHVQIHDDTVLPVHCGGCSAVLHCNHDIGTTVRRGGLIGAPLEHTITACRLCGTETARTTRALDPAELLRSLPVELFDQPL